MGDFGLSILDWRSPSLIFLSGNLSVVLVVLPRAGLAFPLFHLFYFLAGLGCFSESVVDKLSTEKASCIRIKQPAPNQYRWVAHCQKPRVSSVWANLPTPCAAGRHSAVALGRCSFLGTADTRHPLFYLATGLVWIGRGRPPAWLPVFYRAIGLGPDLFDFSPRLAERRRAGSAARAIEPLKEQAAR